MPLLRLAYATQFLIALIAVLLVWTQVGGQSHIDLIPWYVKLALDLALAFAVVKATSHAVAREHAWNGGTLRWLGIILMLLAGCGLATYYAHVYGENEDEEQQDSAIIGRSPGRSQVAKVA